MNVLTLIAKPLIGTGIGQKFPMLHAAFKWLQRLAPREVRSVPIPLGMTMRVVANDNGPGLYLTATGAYEPYETSLFLSRIKRGDTVCDVGAHVGYYTLLGSKSVGDHGRIFAFEPVPDNQSLLQQNLTDNGCTNATLVPHAVSDSLGITKLTINPLSSGDHSIAKNQSGKTIDVSTTTIDAYVAATKYKPSLVKIDVEGAELLVFAGMKRALASERLKTVFIEASSQKNADVIVKSLTSHAFRIFLINEIAKQHYPYEQSVCSRMINRHGYVNLMAIKN